MIGYESLGQISQQRQTLLTDGVPVMRMATWAKTRMKRLIHFAFVARYV